MFRLNAPWQVLELVSKGVHDEVYHAQLCHEVACRYAGEELAFPNVEVADRAAFEGAGEELTDVLHVVMTSCIIESIAGAYLQTCLSMATAPLARAALREILADEIDHARIGWALLASDAVSPAIKAEIAMGLRPLLRGCVASWCQNDKPPGEDPAHGFPSRATVRAIVADSVREIVVPGFDLVGVDTERAHQFIADELDAMTDAATRP